MGYSLTAGVLHQPGHVESDTLQGPHVVFSRGFHETADAIVEANTWGSEAARSLDMPLFRTFTMQACFWERSFGLFILATPVTEDPATNKAYREGFKKLIEVGGPRVPRPRAEPLQCSREP